MRRLIWPLLEMAVALGFTAYGLRWLLGLFGRKRVVFEVTYWRSVYLLAWPLACLAVGLPFVATFFAGTHSAWETALLGALGVVVLGFSVPAFLLHAQYYVRNRATSLVFDPARNRLEVYQAGQRVAFERRDIVRVERVTCRSPRLFWSAYDYLRLHLQDGRVVTLTSLLTDLQPLATFLRNTHFVPEQRWLCWA
ncbi:hypothetical protein F0P96_14905 [Hymenobacter busanensis]|uniref:PH domain-containing protein n=1 Tax=Hymenobacter busanensis TaxID=2607656 RepID=A0A7L4ZYV5_9BACT|nr:hypothetical protein [Hymenobacter busanensis]KAA9331525.1 hypothetical protein F0P96_14905 [Hymenobacter busanensis]QHJ08679.1 hypothetical protein GUY19_15840 [Hymenobacter busanensis]